MDGLMSRGFAERHTSARLSTVRHLSATFTFLHPDTFNETDTINHNNQNPEGPLEEGSFTAAARLMSQLDETNGKQQRTGHANVFSFDVPVI